MTILDQIIDTKRQEIAAITAAGQDLVFRQAGFSQGPSLLAALGCPGLSLIAEIKKASPSKGVIRHDFNPRHLAETLALQGAAALSILTDKSYFMGDPLYIPLIQQNVTLPLLRKEFIIDPIQVYQSKWLGASAILLIKSILDDAQAKDLLTLATTLGLDVLFEVHSDTELSWALAQEEIQIVGINARNLQHFTLDQDQCFRQLEQARAIRPDVILVAESGIQDVTALQRLMDMGTDAVLIGEGLAKNTSLLDWFTR